MIKVIFGIFFLKGWCSKYHVRQIWIRIAILHRLHKSTFIPFSVRWNWMSKIFLRCLVSFLIYFDHFPINVKLWFVGVGTWDLLNWYLRVSVLFFIIAVVNIQVCLCMPWTYCYCILILYCLFWKKMAWFTFVQL